MFNSLSNVLDHRTIVKHEDNVLTFEETETDARLKKVIFSLSAFNRGPSGLIKNAVVIFGDNKNEELLSRFTFFLNTQCPDVNRQCDYIVFHCHNGKTRVILCELKSSDTSQDLLARIHKQFAFSKIFANYLVEVAKEYGDASSSELQHCDIEFHKIAFVYMPNVIASLPLGQPPVPNLTINESNGIKSIFVQTDSQGHTKIPWRDFMEAI